MRATTFKKNLSKALSLLNKVAKRPGLVKLRTDENRLVLQATSGEVYLTMHLAAEIKENGEVCVEAFEIFNALKSVKAGYHIELHTQDGDLTVKAGGLTQTLTTKPVEFFPDFPAPQFQALLPGSVLEYGIEKTAFAAAKEKERGALAHLYIDGRGDHLRFVGSDGHRLAVLKIDHGFDLKVRLYHRSLKLLRELLKDAGQRVLIGESDKFVYLSGSSWTMAIRDFSDRYPDYEAVIPPLDTYETVVKAQREDLAGALGGFTRFEAITLELTDRRSFTIKSGTAEASIEADVQGNAGYSLSFIPRQLKEFVDAVGAYTYIEMMLANNEDVPALFKVGDNYLYFVMPVIRK